jgi:hypothetical protein
MPSQNTAKIILDDPMDWEKWNQRCLAQARGLHLYDYFVNDKPLLEEPKRPEIADYPHKTQGSSLRMGTRSQSQPTVETEDNLLNDLNVL